MILVCDNKDGTFTKKHAKYKYQLLTRWMERAHREKLILGSSAVNPNLLLEDTAIIFDEGSGSSRFSHREANKYLDETVNNIWLRSRRHKGVANEMIADMKGDGYSFYIMREGKAYECPDEYTIQLVSSLSIMKDVICIF